MAKNNKRKYKGSEDQALKSNLDDIFIKAVVFIGGASVLISLYLGSIVPMVIAGLGLFIILGFMRNLGG